ncbi:MAG: DUF1801 domain-containing protein [Sandaracinaceae bacterium]
MVAKKTPPKKAPSKKAPSKPKPRADFGQPVDGFFAKQPDALRPITDALRELVEAAAPDADASIKWGMPFYTLNGKALCAIGAHKAHVNLILSAPRGTFDDPEGLLLGEGKTGQHLKLVPGGELPAATIRGWLRTAVALARKA